MLYCEYNTMSNLALLVFCPIDVKDLPGLLEPSHPEPKVPNLGWGNKIFRGPAVNQGSFFGLYLIRFERERHFHRIACCYIHRIQLYRSHPDR
jgi:hypothetical protein